MSGAASTVALPQALELHLHQLEPLIQAHPTAWWPPLVMSKRSTVVVKKEKHPQQMLIDKVYQICMCVYIYIHVFLYEFHIICV